MREARQPRILIVDDHGDDVHLLKQFLHRAGYMDCVSTEHSREVVQFAKGLDPDIIVLDLDAREMNRFDVLEDLQCFASEECFLPVLVITSNAFSDTEKALASGAADFVAKPVDAAALILRIRNLLRMRFLHCDLAAHRRSLGEKIEEHSREAHETQVEMLARLARASESRDDHTGEHTKRVGALSAALAWRSGWPVDRLEEIHRAASLHDIGKIAIPDRILLKPGSLDADEFATIKTHTAIGAKILSGSRFPTLRLAEEIAYYHHERWNGTGYYSICGEDIPLSARIVAVADVFDVLTHSRPYKHAWTAEEALALIRCESGKHFDPELVPKFVELISSSDLSALQSALAAEAVVERALVRV